MKHQIDISTETENEIYTVSSTKDDNNIKLKTTELKVAKKLVDEMGPSVRVYDHNGRIVYETKKQKTSKSAIRYKLVVNWDIGTKVICNSINYYSKSDNTIPDGAYTGIVIINKSGLTGNKIEVKLADMEDRIAFCNADDIKRILK